MMKTKTATMLAMAAVAIASIGEATGNPAPRTTRRTVKVHPKNYTHPMVTSSDDEIRLHNAKVSAAKAGRMQHRLYKRRELLGNTAILQLVPLRHRRTGNTSTAPTSA